MSALLHLDPATLAGYLERTRWFGGKGRRFDVVGAQRLGRLGRLGTTDPEPLVDVLLIEVDYGTETETYQVPLAYYREAETRLDHAFVGWWEDPELGWVHAYDALHDREAMTLWAQAFADDAVAGDLHFHRLPGADLDPAATPSLFPGEQSNSTVFYGEEAALKIFRKVTEGVNPDIAAHRALTEADSPHIALLYGWVEHADGRLHLGMLQQFLRTATDGWDIALTSVRDLLADAETGADEAGGDFAAESARLGETVREVHQVMRDRLRPTGPVRSPVEIAAAMRDRLTDAAAVAPGLARHTAALGALFARVAALDDVPLQAVHGDLHLGQTLRTTRGWKLVDFEGEPATPLPERLRPDSAWRDVAGMLRSFDYAARVVERESPDADADRAAAWVQRNQEAFLAGYVGDRPDDVALTLVRAYEADKAVYEVVYETRNRPSWVDIPLAALTRIGAG